VTRHRPPGSLSPEASAWTRPTPFRTISRNRTSLLLERVAAGDIRALWELSVRHSLSLRALAFGILHDRSTPNRSSRPPSAKSATRPPGSIPRIFPVFGWLSELTRVGALHRSRVARGVPNRRLTAARHGGTLESRGRNACRSVGPVGRRPRDAGCGGARGTRSWTHAARGAVVGPWPRAGGGALPPRAAQHAPARMDRSANARCVRSVSRCRVVAIGRICRTATSPRCAARGATSFHDRVGRSRH